MSLRIISKMWISRLLAGRTWLVMAQGPDAVQAGAQSVFAGPSQPAGGSSAQSSGSGSTGDFQPAKIEIFLGYSWMNSGDILTGGKAPGKVLTFKLNDAKGGFLVDGSYFFKPWLGFTVDTGGHFGSNYDADEIYAGPTFRWPSSGRMTPFAHFLIGWTRLAPANREPDDVLGLAIRGALDFRVPAKFRTHLANGD